MTAPSELERLRQWKAEAITELAAWDDVWIAAGRPGELGRSKAAGLFDLIQRNAAQIEELHQWQQDACHWLAEASSGRGLVTFDEVRAVRDLISRAERSNG